MDLREIEQRFKWEPPREGDKWNGDYGEWNTTAIGTVDGQIIVRVYGRLEKGSTWMKEYSVYEIYSESSGGASKRCILSKSIREDDAKAFAVNYLFGGLRNRIVCSVCRNLADIGGYYEKMANRLRERQLCSSCDFWLEWVEEKDDPLVARIDGRHYAIDPDESVPNNCKGFGGRRHTIRWNDGRERVTTNLWTQGEIPERFKEQLLDNAVFVWDKKAEREASNAH